MVTVVRAQFPSEDAAHHALSLLREQAPNVKDVKVSALRRDRDRGTELLPLIPVNTLAEGFTSTTGQLTGQFPVSGGAVGYDYGTDPVFHPPDVGNQTARMVVRCPERERYRVESACLAAGGSLLHP